MKSVIVFMLLHIVALYACAHNYILGWVLIGYLLHGWLWGIADF